MNSSLLFVNGKRLISTQLGCSWRYWFFVLVNYSRFLNSIRRQCCEHNMRSNLSESCFGKVTKLSPRSDGDILKIFFTFCYHNYLEAHLMVAWGELVKRLIDDNFLFTLSDHDEGSFFVCQEMWWPLFCVFQKCRHQMTDRSQNCLWPAAGVTTFFSGLILYTQAEVWSDGLCFWQCPCVRWSCLVSSIVMHDSALRTMIFIHERENFHTWNSSTTITRISRNLLNSKSIRVKARRCN